MLDVGLGDDLEGIGSFGQNVEGSAELDLLPGHQHLLGGRFAGDAERAEREQIGAHLVHRLHGGGVHGGGNLLRRLRESRPRRGEWQA